MDIMILVINFLLIIIFFTPVVLSYTGYKNTKKQIFIFIILLFSLICIDNVIICITEISSEFSAAYDTMFMTVPAFKTFVYAGTFVCVIKIIELFLHVKTPLYLYVLLAIVLSWLLFIPMLTNSAIKVWCYFLPSQILRIILCIYVLHTMKTYASQYSHKRYSTFRKLILFMGIVSVFIAFEDTIVIFKIDKYADLFVSITERNFTESAMFVICAMVTARMLNQAFQITLRDTAVYESDSAVITEQITESEELTESEDTTPVFMKKLDHTENTTQDYSKFFLFCREYQLTTREQDIVKLLLENKDNNAISEELVISLGTVKAHVHNVFSKTEVKRRQQLIELYEDFQAEETL